MMPINNNDFSSDHVIRNFSDEHLYRGRRNPKSLLNCAKTITTYQKCVNAGSDNRGHPLGPTFRVSVFRCSATSLRITQEYQPTGLVLSLTKKPSGWARKGRRLSRQGDPSIRMSPNPTRSLWTASTHITRVHTSLQRYLSGLRTTGTAPIAIGQLGYVSPMWMVVIGGYLPIPSSMCTRADWPDLGRAIVRPISPLP